MWDYILTNAWQFWAVLCLVCLILELGSGDLFLLSFAIASAVTVFVSFLGMNGYMQLLVFAVSAILTLLLVRPSLLRLLHKGEDKRVSNADALMGKTGVVTQDIAAGGYGRVFLGGDDWKACTEDGKALEKGTRVKFVSRESIVLTVKQL